MIKKKGLIIFDLDGVIINSEKNMEYAWNHTSKKIGEKIKFKSYRKFIGLGFFQILKKLGIKKKKFKKAFFYYNKYSNIYINKIKVFPGIKNELNKIKKKYNIALFTSKNKKRVDKILHNFKIKFEKIVTMDDVVKTKPDPEGLLKIIKLYPYNKNKIFYLGDTNHDFFAAKKSKIKFLHCNWGFFKPKNKKIKCLKKITDISKTFS